MGVKLFSMLLLLAWLTLQLCGEVSSQDLHQVQAEQIPPVRVGGVARFRCSFVGENITVQYISWTKFVKNGRRTFVYEYSQHPPLARPYYDFIGRATIINADMNDNRFSYLNDIAYAPITTPEPEDISDSVALPLKMPKGNTQKATDEHWSNVHESIYGLFSDLIAKGGQSPRHEDIDDLFKGMEDKHTLTHKVKKLKPPVTISDIQRALYPYNTQEPRTIPMRWSDLEATTEEVDHPETAHGEPYDDGFWDSRIIRRRRKRRAVPVHHIDLQLVHVLLSDEATYECLVKPVNGPAVSSSMRLFVQVPPLPPVLKKSETSHADGSNVTLTCKVNAGKPAGEVVWTRRNLKDTAFHEVSEEMYETEAQLMPNYTTSVISRLKLQLTAGDDGTTYRCAVHSSLADNTELPLFAQTSMTVSYPPRGGRILFDTAEGRYYCHARGKPAPSYSWVWLRADGRQTVMSTNRYLDLSGMRHSGYYRFHCLASNNIQGIKHTKVMATKLRVIAPDTEPEAKEQKPIARKYWRRRFLPGVTTTAPPPTTTTTVPTTTTTTTLPTTTTTTPTTTTTRPTTTTTRPPPTTTPMPLVVAAGVASPLIYPGGFPESASRQLIPTFDVTGQKSLSHYARNQWNNIVEPGLEDRGKPEDDYYYYYFYDDGRKERQPANYFNQFNPLMQSGPVEERRYAAPPLPPTKPSPTESPVNQGKTLDWDMLNEIGQRWGFSMPTDLDHTSTFHQGLHPSNVEELSDLKAKLNTDFKQPAPYLEALPDLKMNLNTDLKQPVSYIEDLPELKMNLNTDLKQPVPYNPFTVLKHEEEPQVEIQTQANYDETSKETITQNPIGRSAKHERRWMQNQRKHDYDDHYKGNDDHDNDNNNDNDNEDHRKPKKAKSPKRRRKTRAEVEYKDQARSNKYEKVMVTSSSEFDCTRRKTGIHGAGCRAFYRCIDGRTFAVECRYPYVYNKNTKKCGEPKAAPAPCGKFRDCSNKPSRKYVDEDGSCKYYYTCYRGFFMGHNECNPGLVFNEKIQLCDWPANVKEGCSSPAKKKKKKTARKNRHYRD